LSHLCLRKGVAYCGTCIHLHTNSQWVSSITTTTTLLLPVLRDPLLQAPSLGTVQVALPVLRHRVPLALAIITLPDLLPDLESPGTALVLLAPLLRVPGILGIALAAPQALLPRDQEIPGTVLVAPPVLPRLAPETPGTVPVVPRALRLQGLEIPGVVRKALLGPLLVLESLGTALVLPV
ncbi:uncharacterized protein BO80DRAFT_316294, partial [Aspergillus ibericus CBS 121593]